VDPSVWCRPVSPTPIYDQLRGERTNANAPTIRTDMQRVDHPGNTASRTVARVRRQCSPDQEPGARHTNIQSIKPKKRRGPWPTSIATSTATGDRGHPRTGTRRSGPITDNLQVVVKRRLRLRITWLAGSVPRSPPLRLPGGPPPRSTTATFTDRLDIFRSLNASRQPDTTTTNERSQVRNTQLMGAIHDQLPQRSENQRIRVSWPDKLSKSLSRLSAWSWVTQMVGLSSDVEDLLGRMVEQVVDDGRTD
jgi:hypothetical protein